MHEADSLAQGTGRAVPQPVAGVVAGVVAGAAYLVAQVSLTASVRPGGAAEPLQRIAAILMGPDAAPPPANFDFTVFGMAMIIHFGLAMVFGRVVAAVVWSRPAVQALTLGALTGTAIYALNFGLIAPHAFPWFDGSLKLVTAFDHALFGAVAAAVCVVLRRRAG